MHWVQDFSRCSRQPTIDDFVTANDFKQAQSTAAQHQVDMDQVDTISKAAEPGKLKDERKWPKWYPTFVNYLSTIPGVYGVRTELHQPLQVQSHLEIPGILAKLEHIQCT